MSAAKRGRDAENHACRYLLARGLTLLQRNFRCRRGEIDLILQDADTLVFVEVRYRRHEAYGSAAESVDRHKQMRLTDCARHYLQIRGQANGQGCRFDVIAIDGPDETIEWIRDAFTIAD